MVLGHQRPKYDNELAAQAVFVVVEWIDSAGDAQSYRTSLANPDGVYGLSQVTVTNSSLTRIRSTVLLIVRQDLVLVTESRFEWLTRPLVKSCQTTL